jgi:hypothetical protein
MNQNTIKYQTLDGKIFNAISPTDLINQMRTESLKPGTDIKDFMGIVSQSSYEYNHSNIRTNTHENFVQDLIKAKLIKPLKI